MVVVGVLGAAAILWLARGWDLFFYDEWGRIFYRRSGGVDAFLAPHNGHLEAVGIAVYRVLFATVGLEHYLPYRLAIVGAHLLLVLLIYVYARRRVQPELALVLAVLVLMLGAGWEVIFWPVNLGFVVPLIALVAILLLWDSSGKRAVAGRVLLLVAAVGSSGLGVVVAGAIAVEALWRPDRWRRLLEPAGVTLAWGAWYVFYRPSASTPAALREVPGADPNGNLGATTFKVPSPGDALGHLAEVAQAGVNGALGIDDPSAVPWLTGLALVIGVVAFVKRPAIRTRTVTLTAALGAFWLSLVVSRAEIHLAGSRYIYVSAVLLVLIAAECLSGVRLRRVVLPLVAAATAAIVVAQVQKLDEVSDGAAVSFDLQREHLRRLAGPVPPHFAPDPARMPGVAAGPYRAATDDLGHPSGTAP